MNGLSTKYPWFSRLVYALAAIGAVTVLALGMLGLARLGAGREGTLAPRNETASAIEVVGGTTTPEIAQAPIRRRTFPPPPAGIQAPDLAVAIVATGIINEVNGEFRNATTVSRGEQAGILFDVMNIGTATSARWYFGADLPTFGGAYISPEQSALKPGERARFTIGFRELYRAGENTAVITVDPRNAIPDRDRSNDHGRATLIRGY